MRVIGIQVIVNIMRLDEVTQRIWEDRKKAQIQNPGAFYASLKKQGETNRVKLQKLRYRWYI